VSKQQRACYIDACLVKAARSKAFARFCERVYGRHLGQCGTTDMEQLHALLDSLALSRGERILDLGCGLGMISEYVAEQTGARVTGIDCAAGGIAEAIARAQGKDGILFQVGDMDALDLPARSFDAVIAIDVLYFASDLRATVSSLIQALKLSGRMAVYHTEMVPTGGTTDALEPQATSVAIALDANRLKYTWRDMTENDIRFWTRSKSIAEEMKPEFEAEGDATLCVGRLAESNAVLELAATGRVRRYLYLARV
jgi:ubiquinone/menaquinone biosynthesis C-methylase UbiE